MHTYIYAPTRTHARTRTRTLTHAHAHNHSCDHSAHVHRDKLATPAMVRDFYAGACAGAMAGDPHTPCMVGPGPYYKLWNFTTAHVLLGNNTNIIYTFDYFVPEAWVFGTPTIPQYPGVYNCTTLYTDVWVPVCCPDGPGANITFDSGFVADNFETWAVPVRNAGVR